MSPFLYILNYVAEVHSLHFIILDLVPHCLSISFDVLPWFNFLRIYLVYLLEDLYGEVVKPFLCVHENMASNLYCGVLMGQ